MKPAKAKLIEAAQALLPELQLAADSVKSQLDRGVAERDTCARVDGLLLSGKYILSTHETLTRLLNGGSVNYEALADSVTLEMLANSNAWSTLRYWARRMSW